MYKEFFFAKINIIRTILDNSILIMKNYLHWKIAALCLLVGCVDSHSMHDEPSASPLLLLISFDGFRWDYPDIYHLPHLNSILKRGVRVKHIDNSFATVTFPSHFTIATGLYEETHGIVANHIYDPTFREVATFDTLNDTKWWYVVHMCCLIRLNR